RTRPRRGAAHGCAAFSAEAGCLLGKSRRLRGPGASAPGAQAGCVSLRQVSLHKQRKVARAVTARKPLILMSAEERRVKTRPTGLWRNSRRGKARPTRPVAVAVALDCRPLTVGAPPAPRTPGAAPGAQAGCAFVAPGFF